MNRLNITLTFFILFSIIKFGYAQDISKNAIGLRIGDSDGFGTEITYQRGLSENNRLEVDLGWRSGDNYDGFRLTGIYQWVWNLENQFNWYAGVGGGLASFSYDNIPQTFDDDGETYIYAAGQIGLEYDFDFPLILSLDIRPEFGFGDFNDDLDLDIALGIRYQF